MTADAKRETPKARDVLSERRVGLSCRACGCSHFEVLRTTRATGGRITRERACRNCGRRIKTHETETP